MRIYEQEVRHSLEQLGETVDATVILRIWTRACHSEWTKPPVWLHGDVAPGNLILTGKTLSAMIDFGCCGIGDPACDLTVAWTMFDRDARDQFRGYINLDDAAWNRAKGWAIWKALLQICKGEAAGWTTLNRVIVDC